jgi:phosphoribosyl 1,2-cyclic phosphodiesterase
MDFTVLASGSKANCVYISDETDALIVDAGLSVRETLRRLRLSGGNEAIVRAVLLTHEHGDHVRGASALARKLGVPLYATEGTLGWFDRGVKSTSSPERKKVRYGEAIHIGGFTVETFATSHDAAEPCGYIVGDGGVRLCCCTDTGQITDGMRMSMRRADALILESNHCPEMLKTGPYPEMLKRRISSRTGHLSNKQAAEYLHTCGHDLCTLVLAHLSEVNNTSAKAEAAAVEGFGLFYEPGKVYSIPGGDATECWNHWIRL